MHRAARLVAALASFTLASAAHATDAVPARPSYDLAADGAVTAAALAGTLTLELLKKDLAPLACKWCDPGSLDANVARSVAWSSPHAASTTSDVLLVALPAGVIGYALEECYRLGDPATGWANVLLIAEATSIAMLVNTAVKYAAGRARPYVFLGQPGLYDDPYDRNLSFFSGHATFAFAVAVSGGTLFLMEGLPGAPVALGAGLAVAALTGYLRMAAEQHFLTDVVTGAAVGSLVGWAVPYVFHRPGRKATEPGTLLPAPGGIAIAW